MSIGTHVARPLCLLAAGLASLSGATHAGEGAAHSAVASAASVGPPVAAGGGLLLDRLSKGDLRLWRSIEEIVAASDPAGVPRSPTLRRLWEWARASSHVLQIEIVAPSRLATGMAGTFRVDSVDPAGLRHVAVIDLCPGNIQRARASLGPNSVLSFVRFDGLNDAERYAEVLAHELAHAEYFLESAERITELQAAQGAILAASSRTGRATRWALEDLVRQCEKPLAVMAASEPHAESVEALVARELAGSARSQSR